jgi:hypothetical protein
LFQEPIRNIKMREVSSKFDCVEVHALSVTGPRSRGKPDGMRSEHFR